MEEQKSKRILIEVEEGRINSTVEGLNDIEIMVVMNLALASLQQQIIARQPKIILPGAPNLR